MKKYEIMAKLEEHMADLKEFGVVKIGLFGSHARGDEKLSSDLDFVVEFEVKTFDAYMDCKEYLEKLFSRPVDLVMADSLKPRLQPIILKETVYASGL
jgi:predicted nucleotidyltransferase